MTQNNNSVETTPSNTTNLDNAKKALIRALTTIGKLFQSKSKKSINIYNPKSFDLANIERLAKEVGLVAVHNPDSSTWQDPTTGRISQVPPRLTIAKPQDMNEDDALEFLDDIS